MNRMNFDKCPKNIVSISVIVNKSISNFEKLKFQKLKNDRNIAISQAKPNRNDNLNHGIVRAHFRLTLKWIFIHTWKSLAEKQIARKTNKKHLFDSIGIDTAPPQNFLKKESLCILYLFLAICRKVVLIII